MNKFNQIVNPLMAAVLAGAMVFMGIRFADMADGYRDIATRMENIQTCMEAIRDITPPQMPIKDLRK